MKECPVIYAAINQNDAIREKSSSGGVFYLLAQYVIRRGGIVFGARYNDSWEVVHDYIDSMDKIFLFMGSKYVQSSIGNAFTKAKEFLTQGKLVLFSGTPCQIYGLKAYLGKDYENLILVDLICHGVPSRRVWREYLEYCAEERKIKAINFRDKAEGWLNSSLNIEFEDGGVYRKKQHIDLYMKGFLQNIYLRPSCYECCFKGVKRDTDITLADLWGCKDIMPEMFDDKGISLVIIQTEKGQMVWEEVTQQIYVCKIHTEEYQKYNPYIKKSVNKNEKRQKFYGAMNWKNLEKLTTPSKNPSMRAVKKLKKILGKVIKKRQ